MKPRQYILEVLMRVFQEDAYASLLMRENKMDRKDMPFISEVVYGTIRNYDMLEYQWRSYASGHVKKKIALLLDMSIYQLQYLDGTPSYAVISEAVEMTGKYEKKFVNAVLRNVEKRGQVFPHGNDLKSLSIETSHPLWLLQMWQSHYGTEITKKLCQEDQERPYAFGRINTLKIKKEDLEKGDRIKFLNDISFIYEGILSRTSMFTEGKVVIQDINSAETVRHLDVHPGMDVLDACAAPGTKSQEIAMFMENKGRLVACDLYEKRTHLIEELMARTGVSICTAMVNDAKIERPEWQGSFDRVLVDAPCSGLGDLRHKPEIRLHLKPEDLDEIIDVQKGILDTAASYARKNGILIYSTCTLNKKENEEQIRHFLEIHQEFSLEEEKTIFPFENGGDGFFMAKLRKM
ncbi:MAG: 16S rRNA (cytosine(967)-C(5))-methyltransferase RsmB [Erysipelotrichaceae bacterium]|jgi:16S rRNA (cytosine967-C5)-methyltransferase|nr:16S rRNA (cytosine(967)-C(5))-methyltransferase RsmB [Erysipelotrichaceae bacterium]